jgi:hypothetical protein
MHLERVINYYFNTFINVEKWGKMGSWPHFSANKIESALRKLLLKMTTDSRSFIERAVGPKYAGLALCCAMTIVALMYGGGIALIVAEAYYLHMYTDAIDACGNHVWIAILLSLIFKCIACVASIAICMNKKQNNNVEHAGCTQLALVIWHFVAYYGLGSECYEVFHTNYYGLLIMLKIEVVIGYIFLASVAICITLVWCMCCVVLDAPPKPNLAPPV